MGNGYDDRPTDPNARLMRELEDLRRDVRELQRPSGTQLANAVKELEELIASAVKVSSARFSSGPGSVVIGTSPVLTCSGTIAVPEGYTQAIITAFGTQNAFNDTGSAKSLGASLRVGGSAGVQSLAYAHNGFLAAATTFGSSRLVGISGSIDVEMWASCTPSGSFGNVGFNTSNVNVVALFLH